MSGKTNTNNEVLFRPASRKQEMFIKSICFFTGADWRKFFPERWDLSKVKVWKEYGGNEGFVEYYTWELEDE